MRPQSPKIRIGISGWTYEGWRGVFYPEGLTRKSELQFASRQVNSIEINGSFYSLPRPESWVRWRDETPEDFVFSVKGGRFITHLRRLIEVETPVANFFASGILLLGEKLGPILWQFPPSFRFERERIQKFFDLLPRDTVQAARIARRRSPWMASRSSIEAGRRRPIRHAMEIRNESFRAPEFIELLRENDISLVVADAAHRWPMIEEMTSDFVYARLHGEKELYASGYGKRALDRWAKRVLNWTGEGCDVFVYFDNDVKVHAPFDAIGLSSRTEGLKRAA